jgi:hypothetical protein
MPLTDVKIRTAPAKARRYRLTDSHGLSVEIAPKGKRSGPKDEPRKFWRYRSTAVLGRGLIGQVFNYAIAAGKVTANPVPALRDALVKTEKQHYRCSPGQTSGRSSKL